jgi:hypothetical protein
MNIIAPITITDGTAGTANMLGAGTTLPEDSTAAWTSATYAVGDLRHVVATHRVYRCAVAGSRTISPELDPTNWVNVRPTNRWAPFDLYTSTAATGVTSFTYVLLPGYFNALYLAGLTGATYNVSVKDAPGGSVIFSASGFLSDDPPDWYEYLFSPVKTRRALVLREIPPRPNAELTITISAAASAAVGLGLCVVGDYRSLFGSGDWGGPLAGATAEPITYSYINTAADGTVTIVKRTAATNLRVNVAMPREEADAVLQTIQGVLDVPVAWITTDKAGYAGLTTFGLGSASLSYDSPSIANLQITVKGLI